jgi:hypothetical protein
MSEEIPQELIKKIGQVALTIAYGVHGLTGKKMPGIPSIGASPQQVSQNPAASLSLMNKSRTAQFGLANSPPTAPVPAAPVPTAPVPTAPVPTPRPANTRMAAARQAAATAVTKKGGRRTNKKRRTTYRR